MLNIVNKTCVVFVIFLSVIAQSQANLIIAPMRVVFEDRARTESIVLINNSKTPKTYRMSWSEKLALAEGGYKNLNEEDISNNPIASSMLRMSPKQVTLAPNQRQTIKVSLRKPRNLPDGEYRSHLMFKELPTKSTNDKGQAGIKLSMIMNFSMPVMIRQGNVQQTSKIEDIYFTRSKKNGHVKLKISLSKQGNKSSFGNIEVYFTPANNGKKVEVARLNHFNFYHELDNVIAKPSWFGGEVKHGKLEVIYRGEQEMRGEVLAQKVFTISPSMIQHIP